METVIIVVHLMVIVALVAVVLLQRSEGGALGIGGGGGFMSHRSQGNVLTKATTILGVAFFATSIFLTMLSRLQLPESSVLDVTTETTAPATPDSSSTTPAPDGGTGILNELQRYTGQAPDAGGETGGAPAPALPGEPQVPTSQ